MHCVRAGLSGGRIGDLVLVANCCEVVGYINVMVAKKTMAVDGKDVFKLYTAGKATCASIAGLIDQQLKSAVVEVRWAAIKGKLDSYHAMVKTTVQAASTKKFIMFADKVIEDAVTISELMVVLNNPKTDSFDPLNEDQRVAVNTLSTSSPSEDVEDTLGNQSQSPSDPPISSGAGRGPCCCVLKPDARR